MLLLSGVALAALAVGGPALAADMPVKAPVVARGPAFDWSRCYVGAHAGYGWGNNTNSFGNAVASGPTEAVRDEGVSFPAEFGPFDHDTSGGVVGGQLGCNKVFANNWLVGIEGELFWSGIKGQSTAPEDRADPGAFSRFESRNNWDADLALRLGQVFNQTLLYVKGGVAVGNFRYTETHDDFPTTHQCPGGGVCSVSVTDTRAGLLLGLGVEHVLPVIMNTHWTVKAEYNYINYGSLNIPYPSAAAGIQSFPVKDTKNILKVGVNFYFP